MDLIIINIFFIFFIGLLLYSTKTEGFDNNATSPPTGANGGAEDCPNLLIQDGEEYLLYNTKNPTIKGVNPKVFTKLSDYSKYVMEHPACPVLFLQKGNDAQGKDTYNVRGGTPLNTWKYNGLDQTAPATTGTYRSVNTQGLRTTPIVDSSIQNPPYNQYNKDGYSAFDPRGHDVGRFNPLDAIHLSQELLPFSDTPSDPNWGGIEYTQQLVDGGKYIGNEVYRPVFSGGAGVVVK